MTGFLLEQEGLPLRALGGEASRCGGRRADFPVAARQGKKRCRTMWTLVRGLFCCFCTNTTVAANELSAFL